MFCPEQMIESVAAAGLMALAVYYFFFFFFFKDPTYKVHKARERQTSESRAFYTNTQLPSEQNNHLYNGYKCVGVFSCRLRSTNRTQHCDGEQQSSAYTQLITPYSFEKSVFTRNRPHKTYLLVFTRVTHRPLFIRFAFLKHKTKLESGGSAKSQR